VRKFLTAARIGLVAVLAGTPILLTAGPAAAWTIGDDIYEVRSDAVLRVPAPGVLGNDTTPGDTPWRITSFTGPTPHGTFAHEADGSFTFQPARGFVGQTYGLYGVTDGFTHATGLINIWVANSPPTAVDDSYSATEGVQLVGNVKDNDYDWDGHSVEIYNMTLPLDRRQGTVDLARNGRFWFTPAPDFAGVVTFRYVGVDSMGYRGTEGTVTINVANVEDAPQAQDDQYSATEDVALTVAAPGVLANDTDVDAGATLSVASSTQPEHGTVAVSADGGLTYTPAANYSGADSFTYTTTDGTGTANDTATVQIDVGAVNDAPVAHDDAATLVEDQVLTGSSVLGNDNDIDGGSLTATLVTGPSSGSLVLSADGTYAYTPNANFNGVDTFTYRASDGGAQSNVVTVSLSVGAANDAPTAADDTYTLDEDDRLYIGVERGVLANDADVDGDALTWTLLTEPTHGRLVPNEDGGFVYYPDLDYAGVDSFAYEVSDGTVTSNRATATITMNPINDSPVGTFTDVTTSEDTAVTATLGAYDIDSTDLTYTVMSGPDDGTVELDAATGEFTYTPRADFVGANWITFVVCDNQGLCNEEGLVRIRIDGVNDAPGAQGDTLVTVEDTALEGTINAWDLDSETLTYGIGAEPAHGTVTVTPGAFSYVPDRDFSGKDVFKLEVCDDGGLCATADYDVAVTAVNDSPVVTVPGGDTTGTVDVEMTLKATAVDADDTNLAFTWHLTASPELQAQARAQVQALRAGADLTFTPQLAGTYSFSVDACDPSGACDEASVSVVVSEPPAEPGAGGDGSDGSGDSGSDDGSGETGSDDSASDDGSNDEELPVTGAQVAGAASAGLALLLVGVALVMTRRRGSRTR
jgi:large repetitive protein